MARMTLQIWCNLRMPPPLASSFRERLDGHRLLLPPDGTNSGLIDPPRDPQALEADVCFGQPHPADVLESRRLRWLHINTAGYTRYDREDLKEALRARGAMMSNSSSVYAEPCAQHALAMMLAMCRCLPQAMEHQHGPRDWAMRDVRHGSRLLSGQTALLVGLGAIGRRLTTLLEPFRMNLVGVRRRVRGDEVIPTVPVEEIDGVLSSADHVVNLLPDNPTTRRLFDAERLARIKPGGLFYNIGRGNTVDQDALMAALREGRLAGAYLDVTDPEPLPPDHPLWTTPRCYITPHTAGGQTEEREQWLRHFLENLRRFERGEPLKDRIV